MNTASVCYIISSTVGGYRNRMSHAKLHAELIQLGAVKPLEGMFEGVREDSYLFVPLAEMSHAEMEVEVRRILRKFEQQQALYLDSARLAYSFHVDGGTTYLGKWKELVTLAEMKGRESWSKDHLTGCVYGID